MKRIFFLFVILLICQLVSQAQEAKRIVSLVPWVTKSLYLMGEQHRLVGCTSYCPVEASDPLNQNARTFLVSGKGFENRF